jgi:hypothetical protein
VGYLLGEEIKNELDQFCLGKGMSGFSFFMSIRRSEMRGV